MFKRFYKELINDSRIFDFWFWFLKNTMINSQKYRLVNLGLYPLMHFYKIGIVYYDNSFPILVNITFEYNIINIRVKIIGESNEKR
jgi:hypothetical protein